MKWYEIIVFLIIAMALFRPGAVLNPFYPEFKQVKLSNGKVLFNPDENIQIKVTRQTNYGPRYKLFEIKKKSFEQKYSLEDYGINLVNKDGKIIIDTLKWNGLAKKSGLATDDIITEIKIENPLRPDKDIVYPFAIILLLIAGYFNKKRNVAN